MNRSTRRTLATALVLLGAAASAHAAVFIPTKFVDTADGACTAADCSLREAVIAANQNPGADVILLHDGTYFLTIPGNSEDLAATGDLDIQGELVLLGDGAASTVINGNAIDRVFQVPSGVAFEIRDVTITKGLAPGLGGAILNAGELTIERSVLTNNVSVSGPAGAGFGGGLFSDGLDSQLTVSNSTIQNNTSQGGGGGLAAGGDVTLANVTFSGNLSQADFGGGLYVFSDARLTANNITVANNTAALKGGGILAENSAFIGVAPRITNSIFAFNTASSDPDCSGPVDSSYNLVRIGGAGCVGPSAANQDLVGTAAIPIDAKVDALQGAGGPTPTHPLLAGSPAINAANPAAPGSGNGACEATDQRGVSRPGSQAAGTPRCDMGAYEVTTACVTGGPVLCLSNGRFRLTATWQTTNANGTAQGVPLTDASGYFWFFDPSSADLTVKVLNACSFNNRYWVFLSGLTNVKVDITVTDTKTGTTKIYRNPQGRVFRTILDTTGFATCP